MQFAQQNVGLAEGSIRFNGACVKDAETSVELAERFVNVDGSSVNDAECSVNADGNSGRLTEAPSGTRKVPSSTRKRPPFCFG